MENNYRIIQLDKADMEQVFLNFSISSIFLIPSPSWFESDLKKYLSWKKLIKENY